MKTNDLIDMLATGANLEQAGDPWRRLVHAIGFGTLVSTILMVKAIPVNPDLANVMQLLAFWEKLGFAAAIAAVALLMVFRLSTPGVRLGNLFPALMAPILAIWILAGIALASAEPGERASLFFGNTWKVCPLSHNDARNACLRRKLLGDARPRAHQYQACRCRRRPVLGRRRGGGLLLSLPRTDSSVYRFLVFARHPDPDGGRRRGRGKAAPLVGTLVTCNPKNKCVPSRPNNGDIRGYRTEGVAQDKKKGAQRAPLTPTESLPVTARSHHHKTRPEYGYFSPAAL